MTDKPPLDGHDVALRMERLVTKVTHGLWEIRHLEADASDFMGPVSQTHTRLVGSGLLTALKDEIENWENLK